MKTQSALGKEYVGLVLERAGMMGDVIAHEARIKLASLVKEASDGDLEEAARNLARNAAMGGSDYDSEFKDSLDHLKKERKKLNSIKPKCAVSARNRT
jgi:hypothetical protein